MIDFAKIVVKAGNGGSGVVSFYWIPKMRHGKPDGGDGGSGGDVYFEATTDLNTLEPFRYVKEHKAEDGGRGGKNHKKGKDGQVLIIKVPIGTQVKETNETKATKGTKATDKLSPVLPLSPLSPLLLDLVRPGQKVLIALGGIGGKGNSRFKSSTNRSPKQFETGGPGEQKQLTLELKLLADVGLVGLPNAGKSTLLSVLTSAKPKIADYPFTTLEPNLGVMRLGNQVIRQSGNQEENPDNPISRQPDSLVIADIPGLIEGASVGKGLGEEFLRHVERTKLLLHLVSLESENPFKDYQTVKKELAKYSKDLAEKKVIVVLTKSDISQPNRIKKVTDEFSKKKIRVLEISAVTHKGLEELKKEILKNL